MAEARATKENPPLNGVGAAIKEGWDNLRIGDGHFRAWIRQGFKELTHMLLPAFPQGQHIIEEPGLWGNPTQGEVARSRQDEDSVKQQVSVLNEEPMSTQISVRSPADLIEGRVSAPAQGQQQQSRPELSPADLAEAKQNAAVQSQQQSRQDISPADLSEGKGVSQQQQQTQRQGQQQNQQDVSPGGLSESTGGTQQQQQAQRQRQTQGLSV